MGGGDDSETVREVDGDDDDGNDDDEGEVEHQGELSGGARCALWAHHEGSYPANCQASWAFFVVFVYPYATPYGGTSHSANHLPLYALVHLSTAKGRSTIARDSPKIRREIIVKNASASP